MMRYGLTGMVCVALLAAGVGCTLVHSDTKESVSGNVVPESSYGQITEGKTTAGWVRATLGEPSERTKLEDGSEIWRWSYTERRTGSGHVFILFSGSSDDTKHKSVFVEFRDDVVKKKWRT